MREDVRQWAELMSAVMDRKQIERKAEGKPHYTSEDYQLLEALSDMQRLLRDIEQYMKAKDKVYMRSALVHIANYCFIADYKCQQEWK